MPSIPLSIINDPLVSGAQPLERFVQCIAEELAQVLLAALVLICPLLQVGVSDNPPRVPHAPLEPPRPGRRRAKESKPFPGLIHQPLPW
jgi:hypothetical protein